MKHLVFVSLAAIALFVLGCPGDPTGVAGSGGEGGAGGIGGIGGTGGDFQGFTVAPPPSEEEFQPKNSFEDKFNALVESAEVPSALAGAFFQLSRAYLSGRDPQNDLEADAFAVLDNTTQEVRDAIARTVDAIIIMPGGPLEKLYGAPFIGAAPTDVLTVDALADAVGAELIARATLANADVGLDLSACAETERAGLPRVASCFDVDGNFDGFCNSICRVQTDSLPSPIRTVQFRPGLMGADYQPFETQQICSIDAGGVVSCGAESPPDCTGTSDDGVCLAVPTVEAGETVIFQGFNFFDVDAKILFINLNDMGATPREIDAFVCGDVDTPAEAPIDCAVNDLISFQIPSDLAPGRYRIVIEVPNNVGNPMFTAPTYLTDIAAPVIQVVPPSSTMFQLQSEEFHSINETSELFSDEIGIKIITVGTMPDGTFGELETIDFEFGDMDQGERRRMDRTHFSGTVGEGFGIGIVGFEIDNREAFEKTITDFADAFVEISQGNWGKISAAVGTVVGGFVGIFATPAIGAAVGAALTFAINAVVALWAPADLVIEDFAGVSFLRVAELTSLNFANPPVEQRTTANGIEVTVEPCEDTEERDRPECDPSAKGANQYRERREYGADFFSFPAGSPPMPSSQFQITFRYNRLN